MRQTQWLRMVDASVNRIREGLRVLEDYVRFVLDDRFLTETLKGLRHRLTEALAGIPELDRLLARETQQDVGTALTERGEQDRQSLQEVLAANFHRVQEGLRSLEEWAKLYEQGLAWAAKEMRYQMYTLERALRITCWSAQRLAHAQLYVLIDGANSPEQLRHKLSCLLAAGVPIVQLRDKQLPDRQLLERAQIVREITNSTNTLFIMNDRPDLALLTQADGVHLGQQDLPLKQARQILGPEALIGVSTHSLAQAQQALLDGANYIGLGPTFASPTKAFTEFAGLELLRQVAQQIRLPAFAIGGITLENLPQVLSTGIRRVAVHAAIWQAPDPGQAAKKFLSLLAQSGPP